ncbi:MAG: 1-(5-phosphoribosyl)-5-[(5-phosphoribosylamino)methylideneamino]imidazole-4-carboxamide isomerase [Thermoguttaceae bacterium]
MDIWVAIDLRGGRCVRLRQGDYNQETVFGDNPVAMAKHWHSLGARMLHLVDLDGARDGKPFHRDVVSAIVRAVDIPCEIGGGIRDEETIAAYLNDGVARVVIGTQALKNPAWFRGECERYPQRLVLGIDARNGMVATEGWLKASTTSATELASQWTDAPLAGIIYTDIATDGMMQGPNIEAMTEMRTAVAPLPVIASGGVTTLDDIKRLAHAQLPGCVIGRALYEGTISLPNALTLLESC